MTIANVNQHKARDPHCVTRRSQFIYRVTTSTYRQWKVKLLNTWYNLLTLNYIRNYNNSANWKFVFNDIKICPFSLSTILYQILFKFRIFLGREKHWKIISNKLKKKKKTTPQKNEKKKTWTWWEKKSTERRIKVKMKNLWILLGGFARTLVHLPAF